MPRFIKQVILSLIGIFSLSAASVFAATDQADLSVGMKTLPLLTNKLEGTATVAIIFDPALPASREEASGIKAILDGGFQAPGNLKLNGILVPANEMNKLAGSKIAIVTSGLNAQYNAIGAMAASGHLLTMSTDLSCVQANKCIIGIISKPRVQIYYSKEAADAAQISFGQVFTMLVTSVR